MAAGSDRVGRHLKPFLLISVVCAAVIAIAPTGASPFGTVNIFIGLHQRSEHERITRLALGCRPGQPHDGSCFEGRMLDNLAGTNGTFGAVGAPDDLPLRLGWGGPAYWHCDDADYLDAPGYPQSRQQATAKLDACRQWARDMLFNGRPNDKQEQPSGAYGILPRTWPVTGALAEARKLLNSSGNVDVGDPGTGFFSPPCTFNGQLGRAKCSVYEPFGYVLHVTEDFYSHSNWVDHPSPNSPISVDNPPGLAHRDLPAFWDLRKASAALPDSRLSTGCYPKKGCPGRTSHDELNKDNENINTITGFVDDPINPRGKVYDNAQRAVNGAINEARRQWAIFRYELVQRYGAERGGKMICALTSDNANSSCNNAQKARDEFAKVPPPPVRLATVENSGSCLDLRNGQSTDGNVIQGQLCHQHEAQEFQFAGTDIQFNSVGTSSAVRVMGKCLEASGGGVRIKGCNGSAEQRVAVTPTGELKLLGKCITFRGNGQPVELGACRAPGSVSDQLWQFR